MYYHACTLQKNFNHWVVTLVAGDSGYEKFILVLEINSISNLSPNHIPYNWQPSEQLWASHYTKYDSLADVQWLLYLQDNACSLIHAGFLTTDNPQNICERVSLTAFDAFVMILSQILSGYYICKIMLLLMFFDTCRCDLFQRCIISGYYIYTMRL